MKIENNMPAFPETISNQGGYNSQEIKIVGGMTMLDYFAGRAMQGIITSDDQPILPKDIDMPKLAMYSYQIAAAMLEARKNYD